ncbi:germin subfamily 1 member 17 [Olea europaea subsp. europaea]|uniref:Germin subfamily 1 member 17 n=1 Tax=Olea europaea subsp. europaea TaxID=158383 RepID=A0A8S0Q9J9_OLEEU|nr:germin subfamily 1 member 17 [Olea europaea subsp. europaea]
MAVRLLISVLIISLVSLTYASDPDPLQDFCVAVKDDEAKVFVNGKICKDPNMVSADDFLFPGPNMPGLNVPGNTSNPLGSKDFCVAVKDDEAKVFVNGKICKDPNMVSADDFLFPGPNMPGLNVPGNTSNPLGSKVTPVNVNQLPGLNTLGISLVRIDYAPYGLNPPHTHPRATEVLVVVEGTLYVGFVTSNPADPNVKNKLFTKTLNPGDVFVFPEGLIHFQFNVGKTNAVVFAGLSSQNPGVITIANAVFGSNPPINLDVLTKAFQVDANVIKYLQGQFCCTKNGCSVLISVLIISLASFTYASDPAPLQDFCVAVKDANAKVRIDYAPYGLNPPHTHPRATEVLVVVEGTLYVGFVTSNPADPNVKNKLFTKTLYPGDVFVFPEGLIHFQFNVGKTNAVVFAGLSSQNPGVITIANAVFGSDPPINIDVLTKAFQVDVNVIKYLQGQFWWNID